MKCECCGIEDWNGKPLRMQLHHKNGKHNDNRLENLEVLCPNCHSQTENFAGRNSIKIPKLSESQEKKKAYYGISEDGQRLYDGYGNYKILCPVCQSNFMNKEAAQCRQCFKKEVARPKISKEELYEIMENHTYASAAKILGVKDDTVSRWHKYYVQEDRKEDKCAMGRNKSPSRDILKTKIRTTSFVQIGKEYGVTDNSVKKWCDAYKLPRLKSEINKYSDEEWELI